MHSRKLLIAANLKMNPLPEGALQVDSPYRERADIDIVIFPSFLDIAACREAKFLLGGQYGHPENAGARTGDISMAMLAAAGCRYVLCGHSERRQYHGETGKDIVEQVIAALEVNIHPIICVGETEKERHTGEEKKVIENQLKGLPLESAITIAYEPVWAIGTGKTASPQDAEEMHAFIRSLLPEDKQEETRILYGGSMKPENAEELLQQPNIDGGLIGGASLKLDQFARIVEIAATMTF